MENDDFVELLKRRVEEEVKANVEEKLFKYYRNLGAAIVVVLGAFGFSVGWPALKSGIDAEIKDQIQAQVKQPLNKAIGEVQEATKAAVADAHEATERAKSLAEENLPRLEIHQQRISESIGGLNPRFDAINARIGEAKALVESLNSEAENLRNRTEFLRTQVQADPIQRAEMVDLEKRLSVLIEQVQDIRNALPSGETVDVQDPGSKASLSDLAGRQAEIVKQAQAELNDTRKSAIVYVQFAGGRREDIETVSEFLAEKGWNVPGEERTGNAAGKQEIRYYYDNDANAAKMLAADLSKSLLEAGFAEKTIETRQLNPENFKIRPNYGILEVWIEIPLRSG